MKAVVKMKDSGAGFPSGLLLFDTSPGPAITRSPLCIKDVSTEVLLPPQGKGSARTPEGTKDGAGGSQEILGWPQALVSRQLDGDEPESTSFTTISAYYYHYQTRFVIQQR